MEILGVTIDNLTKKQLIKKLADALNSDSKIRVVKINAEFVQRCQKSDRFKKVVNSADIRLVDGRGVQWAAKYLTLPISDNLIFRPIQAVWQMIISGARIVLMPKYIKNPIAKVFPGVEALRTMLGVAEVNNSSVFIFGSKQQTLELAIDNIKKEFPKLKIAGSLNGYDFQSDKNINPVEIINQTNAKMLFVALGSPKQDYWIAENIDKLKNIKIAVGEGGTLDRIAQPKQIAPEFINKIGLEWLWRLFANKSRTEGRGRLGRFWVSVPSFIGYVVKWKIKYGQAKN